MEAIVDIGDRFSTADAEGISFHYDGAELRLTFTDWRGGECEVIFPDSIFIQWGGTFDDRFRSDTPYEVLDSARIRTLPEAQTGHHHYVLCFNAAANLEIVSQEMKVKKAKD